MLVAPLPGRETRPTPAEVELDGQSFMATLAAYEASKAGA